MQDTIVKIIICLSLALGSSQGIVDYPNAVPGSCPTTPTAMANFDLQRYAGVWYEAASIPSFFLPKGTKCVKTTQTKYNSTVLKTHEVSTEPSGSMREECDLLIQHDSTGNLRHGGDDTPYKDYTLLDTDYTSYNAVYSCEDYLSTNGTKVKLEYGWIMARTTNPTEATLKKAYNAFTSRGISIANFQRSSQANCGNYAFPGNSCNA